MLSKRFAVYMLAQAPPSARERARPLALSSQDLVIGNKNSANELYRNDGSGKFTVVHSPITSGNDKTNALAWGDMDGDGDLVRAATSFERSVEHMLAPTLPTTHKYDSVQRARRIWWWATSTQPTSCIAMMAEEALPQSAARSPPASLSPTPSRGATWTATAIW